MILAIKRLLLSRILLLIRPLYFFMDRNSVKRERQLAILSLGYKLNVRFYRGYQLIWNI